MSALSISVPYPVFSGQDGLPLDNGYVWIGTANLYPITNPIAVYFDEALTVQATQPLRTINGFISNAGTPAQVYVDAVNFSIVVQDSKGTMVYNFPDGTGISPDACGVEYDPPFIGGVPYPVCEKLAQTVSVKDFGAVGDGVADDTAAIQAALDTDQAVFFPNGNYVVSAVLNVGDNRQIFGSGIVSSTILTDNVFTVDTKSDITFSGLKIETGILTDVAPLRNAIYVKDSTNVQIVNCSFDITPNSAAAIWFENSDNCAANNNYISCPTLTPSILGATIPNGIVVHDGCSDIVVANNVITNIGQGVNVSADTTADIKNVTVSGNAISECSGYGINVYCNLPIRVQQVTVQGNTINTVYGSYLNPATSSYTHGAGIYLQSAQECIITGNTIFDVCKNTNSQSLAPASIGMNSLSNNCILSANNIAKSEFFGIIADGNYNNVVGNTIKNTKFAAIRNRVSTHLSIVGNTISFDAGGTSNDGISLGATSNSDFTIVSANNIFNSTLPISCSRLRDGIVSNNVCKTTDYVTTQGIGGSLTERVNVISNILELNGGFGIRVQGTNGGTIKDNIIYGATSGQALLNVPTGVLVGNNLIETFNNNDKIGRVFVANAQWLDPGYWNDSATFFEVSGTGTIEGITQTAERPFQIIYLRAPATSVIQNMSVNATGNNIKFRNASNADITITSSNAVYSYINSGSGIYEQVA